MTYWPDPRDYRQELPGSIWRRYEHGWTTRAELWEYLARLWGEEEVRVFIATRQVAA